MSDGLVSNLALVMGVAGASEGEGSFVLLAGIAGLLAGSFSMAAGEYISMQSQRELFERMARLQRPGDLLFLGHSESLYRVSDRYELVGRTIYRRLDN